MNTETKAPEQPSKEQIVLWYNEQIEIATLRKTLSELNKDIATFDAQRLKATIMIAQMQEPQKATGNEIEHEVTQEDLDANPELVENNVKVGDKILISGTPTPEEQTFEEQSFEEDQVPVRTLKKE